MGMYNLRVIINSYKHTAMPNIWYTSFHWDDFR